MQRCSRTRAERRRCCEAGVDRWRRHMGAPGEAAATAGGSLFEAAPELFRVSRFFGPSAGTRDARLYVVSDTV